MIKILDLKMNDNNSRIGMISGVLGGLTKVFLSMDANFLNKVLEGGFVAFVCGFLGVAGKELFELLKKYIKNRRLKKKLPKETNYNDEYDD